MKVIIDYLHVFSPSSYACMPENAFSIKMTLLLTLIFSRYAPGYQSDQDATQI
jgi:hypothetical protein